MASMSSNPAGAGDGSDVSMSLDARCKYNRCRQPADHTIADCPYRIDGPGRLRGSVVDAGGGYVKVFVDRDTHSYPPDGTKVMIQWRL